jgi:hypothetical protein
MGKIYLGIARLSAVGGLEASTSIFRFASANILMNGVGAGALFFDCASFSKTLQFVD